MLPNATNQNLCNIEITEEELLNSREQAIEGLLRNMFSGMQDPAFIDQLVSYWTNKWNDYFANSGMMNPSVNTMQTHMFAWKAWVAWMCKMRCYENLNNSVFGTWDNEWNQRTEPFFNASIGCSYADCPGDYDALLTIWTQRLTDEVTLSMDGNGFTNACSPVNNVYIKGSRHYELSNHLGNVLAVVSDRKIEIDDVYTYAGAGSGYKYENGFYIADGSGDFTQSSTADGIISTYAAEVVSANDYYAFGSSMPGRSFNSGEYCFGFNGHEKDDEIKGLESHISFGDYGYDPRLGRRLNLDPVVQVDISGYSTLNNNPISLLDPTGESPITPFIKMAVKKGLKVAVKEYVETVIRKKAMDYVGKKLLSKSFAKQFADDALGAMDLMTSEWWEIGIEFIPWLGDAYGATKLYKQTKAVWDRLKVLENRLDKIADFQDARKIFWRKFPAIKGLQAHHIIPFEALSKNKYIQEAIDAGWDINKRDNGRLLANGFHTNHPAYSTFIDNRVNQWVDDYTRKYDRAPNAGEIKNYLDNELTPQLNKLIDKAKDAWENGGEENLNKFFKKVNSQTGS